MTMMGEVGKNSAEFIEVEKSFVHFVEFASFVSYLFCRSFVASFVANRYAALLIHVPAQKSARSEGSKTRGKKREQEIFTPAWVFPWKEGKSIKCCCIRVHFSLSVSVCSLLVTRGPVYEDSRVRLELHILLRTFAAKLIHEFLASPGMKRTLNTHARTDVCE